MSGSVNSVIVTLSPAQLARIEREREARRRLRSVAASMKTAAIGAASQVHRSEETSRAASRDRAASPRRARLPGAKSVRTEIPATDRAPGPAGPPVHITRLRHAVIEEARKEHLDEIVAAATAATDLATLTKVEQALDDAIDAAQTRHVVAARLDEVGQAVLGTAWTAQPSDAASTDARVLRAIQTTAAGTAVVELAVDAAREEINGRPSQTCGDENRIAREVLTGLASEDIRVTGPPSSGRAASARLEGLTATRRGATGAQIAQEVRG